MAVLTDGTLTRDAPEYYNASLDTTGGHLAVTQGQLAFLDIYVSAKTLARYGTTTPTSPRQFILAAGTTTIPRDPSWEQGSDWTLFVKAASGTVEIAVLGHNNAGFRAS